MSTKLFQPKSNTHKISKKEESKGRIQQEIALVKRNQRIVTKQKGKN